MNLAVTHSGRKVVSDVIARRRVDVGNLLTAIDVGARRYLVDALTSLSAAAGEAPELDWTPGWRD